MADQQRQDVAYLSDIEGIAKVPSGAVVGNIPLFGANGVLSDSNKKPADFVDGAALASAVQTAVASSTTEIWDAIKGVDALQAYGASAWAAGTTYAVGAFCRHRAGGYDGHKCTEDHTAGQTFDASKWEGVLTTAGRTAIDSILSDCRNDGLVSLANLAPDYDDLASYEVDQLVVKDGQLQRCTVAGSYGDAEFSPVDALEGSIAGRIAAVEALIQTFSQEQADWDETDSSDPSYIRNKPVLQTPYRIEELSALNPGDAGYRANAVSYALKDRTVNVIKPRVGNSEVIRLVPPASPGSGYARELYVVVYASALENFGPDPDDGSSDPDEARSGEKVPIEADGFMIECCDGTDAAPYAYAVIGRYVTFRLVETGLPSERVFLASGFADAAYQKTVEIERAVDAILASGGGGDFALGIYLPDGEGYLHKVTAVKDDETGEYNVGVENEGIPE